MSSVPGEAGPRRDGRGTSGIVVRTLAERVFEIVREQIVTGRLVDNAPIRQDALATELGVSKIPLREALARLEHEGLLTSHANRGYFVQPMSADRVEEIYALRISIEPRAAAFAAERATEADHEMVIEAFQRLDGAAATNLAEVAVCNRDFHTALVRPGGRLLTTQLIERLSILAERYVIAHLQPAGRETRAHAEHRELLDAWIARDTDKLVSMLTEHLQRTLDDLRLQFGSGA